MGPRLRRGDAHGAGPRDGGQAADTDGRGGVARAVRGRESRRSWLVAGCSAVKVSDRNPRSLIPC
jgi:hypothetical protein